MVLSDTLSRLPNPKERSEIQLDVRVDGISIDLINFSLEKQVELRKETLRSPVLSALAEVVYQGWPERMSDLPTDLRSYWSYRDTIGINNGILFKGKQVVVPEVMQEDILHQLHRGHLGVEKTRMLARDSVYWTNVNKDIEKMVKRCTLCQEEQNRNTKEPMIPSATPTRAWQTVGTDLFEIKGKQFIIISDYYSKYPIVKEMLITSKAVATLIEETCAMFG